MSGYLLIHFKAELSLLKLIVGAKDETIIILLQDLNIIYLTSSLLLVMKKLVYSLPD